MEHISWNVFETECLKMKFELYLIIAVGILVMGILYLVYLNPNEITYYSSFQNQEFDTFGDYHLEPIGDNEKHWATISDIILIDDQTIKIVFRGNNPNDNNPMADYGIPNDFEYSHLVKKGQTFVPLCVGGNVPKDNVRHDAQFLQYMGVVQLSESYYYEFYHTNADLPNDLVCKYPQIIQHSFNVEWDIKEHKSFQKFYSNGSVIQGVNSSMIIDVAQPCRVLDCKSS